MLEVRLLGQFDVRLDGVPVDIHSRTAQSLLAYMIMRAGTSHRREQVAGLFWPELSDTRARSNLRNSLWLIRRSIGDSYIAGDKIAVRFDSSSEYWLDVENLEAGDLNLADSQNLGSAASVYSGELLPGFYDDWIVLDREHVRGVFEQRMQQLTQLLIGEQDWEQVLAWSERWIALSGTTELAYRAMMIARAGMGDLAGVAATYSRCEQALQEDLGVAPSQETRNTYEWLSRGGQASVAELDRISAPGPGSSDAAIHALLHQWKLQQIQTLDVASLAIIHAAPPETEFSKDELELLLWSTLQRELDLEPWVTRAQTKQQAVDALMYAYEAGPRERARDRLVEALASLDADEVDDALYRIVEQDGSPNVREHAALVLAGRGHGSDVSAMLLKDIQSSDGANSLPAFVAVLDDYGVPEDSSTYPRFRVGLQLMRKRWRETRDLIMAQLRDVGIGGAASQALSGLLTPLVVGLTNPERFVSYTGIFTTSAWACNSALVGLVWGGLHGAALGFMVGTADGLSRPGSRWIWRNLAGMASGAVHSIILISLTLMNLNDVAVGAPIFVPAMILFGATRGIALSWVIPILGTIVPLRTQLTRMAAAAVVISGLTIVYAIGVREPSTFIVGWIPTELFFIVGVSLPFLDFRIGKRRSLVGKETAA